MKFIAGENIEAGDVCVVGRDGRLKKFRVLWAKGQLILLDNGKYYRVVTDDGSDTIMMKSHDDPSEWKGVPVDAERVKPALRIPFEKDVPVKVSGGNTPEKCWVLSDNGGDTVRVTSYSPEQRKDRNPTDYGMEVAHEKVSLRKEPKKVFITYPVNGPMKFDVESHNPETGEIVLVERRSL